MYNTTLKTRSPLKRRTTLRNNAPLRRFKHLSPCSPKQRVKNALWAMVTAKKAERLHFTCQWCHQLGKMLGFNRLAGHHIKKRRYNNHTDTNCYICHWLCHGFIELNNIDVRVYPDKASWEAKR